MSESLRRHFADYGAFHTTRGNRACHSLGIPIIVLASLSLLAHVPLVTAFGVTLTLAEALIALFALYDPTLDRALAVMMLATGRA